MGRLRIEKPIDTPLKKAKGKKPLHRGRVLLLFLVPLFIGLIIYLFLNRGNAGVQDLPSLEVESFSGDVQLYDPVTAKWQGAERGMRLSPGGKIKAGEGAEADLHFPGYIKVRVKPESEIFYRNTGAPAKRGEIQFELISGISLLSTEKRASDSGNFEMFHMKANDLKARAQQGYFYLEAGKENSGSVGVMRGKAEVQQGKNWTEVKGLHAYHSAPGGSSEPLRISREEWNVMREVYDMQTKSAAMEALQLDLSKKAGNFFEYVFDHGTFYTPKFGYSGREFFIDDASGEVFLEVEYDVFPKGSFVGTYMKTRGLDLSEYSALEFELRKSPEDEGEPKTIRIEMKSSAGVVRAFAAKLPQKLWQKQSFPLHIRTPTLLTEMTLVFLHDRVGDSKKGSVQIRRINLVPVGEAAAAANENTFESKAQTENIMTRDLNRNEPGLAASVPADSSL